MMTAAAMLLREGRRWGDCDDDDGEEEVVEVRWTTTTRPSRQAKGRVQGVLKEDGG